MLYDLQISNLDKKLKALNDNVFGEKSFVAFVHADWCGHCTRFIPEWKKFIQMAKKEMIGLCILDIKDTVHNEIISSSSTSLLSQVLKKTVSGFPTIFLVEQKNKNGKRESIIHQFNGERTASGLFDFVKKIIPKEPKELKVPKEMSQMKKTQKSEVNKDNKHSKATTKTKATK
jgi:thiol-disulfide isomerase/thioredoxin